MLICVFVGSAVGAHSLKQLVAWDDCLALKSEDRRSFLASVDKVWVIFLPNKLVIRFLGLCSLGCYLGRYLGTFIIFIS